MNPHAARHRAARADAALARRKRTEDVCARLRAWAVACACAMRLALRRSALRPWHAMRWPARSHSRLSLRRVLVTSHVYAQLRCPLVYFCRRVPSHRQQAARYFRWVVVGGVCDCDSVSGVIADPRFRRDLCPSVCIVDVFVPRRECMHHACIFGFLHTAVIFRYRSRFTRRSRIILHCLNHCMHFLDRLRFEVPWGFRAARPRPRVPDARPHTAAPDPSVSVQPITAHAFAPMGK